MNILVTGNLGYIGTVLTEELFNRNYRVIGCDTGFYEVGLKQSPDNFITKQIVKDIREIEASDLQDIHCIIHLAGLSNDPLGEFNPNLTEDINFTATVKLAKLAKENGIERFIYASSQSMYGISKSDFELDEDRSKKNPLTSYAKTKWEAEQIITDLNSSNFTTVAFRPSTVFGASSRIRCDIVYNNLVASAYCTGKIEILSDGTPWRPVVHVQDVSRAFIAGIEAPKNLVEGEAFNVGIENGNFTVKDLALAAQRSVIGSELFFKNEHTDPRSYKVSFNKIFKILSKFYKPKWDLKSGGEQLVKFFDNIKLNEEMFRGEKCNRLKRLKLLTKTNKIDSNLKWR